MVFKAYELEIIRVYTGIWWDLCSFYRDFCSDFIGLVTGSDWLSAWQINPWDFDQQDDSMGMSHPS